MESDFILGYNLEDINLADRSIKIAFPMVCFCDIPLSSISEHLDKYGQYAIGMSINWANKNGLNPVLYIKNDSSLSKQLWNLANEIFSGRTSQTPELESYIADIMRYIKPFEGQFLPKIGGAKPLNVKFYDEREWRYVPTYDAFKIGSILSEEMYEKLKNKSLPNDTLKFTPKDVKYLIVPSDNKISPLIKSVKNSKENYSLRDVDLLHSRIITVDQIKSDF